MKKFINTLVLFLFTLMRELIARTKTPGPAVPVVRQIAQQTEFPVLSADGRETQAQRLMSGIATLQVNHRVLAPVQTDAARQEALKAAAERRARRALRRQGLAVTT